MKPPSGWNLITTNPLHVPRWRCLSVCPICYSISARAQDFSGNPNRTYPSSCCDPDIADQISISHKPLASAVVFRADDSLSRHQRNISEMAEVAWSHVIPRDSARRSTGGATLNSENEIIATCRAVYPKVSYRRHQSVWVMAVRKRRNKRRQRYTRWCSLCPITCAIRAQQRRSCRRSMKRAK